MKTFLSWFIVITMSITIITLLQYGDIWLKDTCFKPSLMLIGLILGYNIDDFRKWLFNIK